MFRRSRKELEELRLRVEALENPEVDVQAEVTKALEVEREKLWREDLALRVKKLEETLERLSNAQPSFSQFPLWLTDEEAEAKHLLDTGQIDNQEYKDILASAGLLNAEIEFPSGSAPALPTRQ